MKLVSFGFLVVGLGLLSVGYASAAPQHCSTLAVGKWKITSYHMDDVSAISGAEAKSNVGKDVIVDNKKVVFTNQNCVVQKIVVGSSSDEPGYPFLVEYKCSGKVYIPAFFIGKSCQRILAGIDGATYVLEKVADSGV